MEEDQKRRATRGLRDGIDRILVDLLSLYRDLLLHQLGVGLEPVNLAIEERLIAASAACTPAETLATMDAIATARKRIEANVTPTLALEAMLVSAVR
jgi:DNA polymerase-3 subunit delta'